MLVSMDPTTAARVSTLLMLASLESGKARQAAGADEPKGTVSSENGASLSKVLPTASTCLGNLSNYLLPLENRGPLCILCILHVIARIQCQTRQCRAGLIRFPLQCEEGT